jgi:hypothetical protein
MSRNLLSRVGKIEAKQTLARRLVPILNVGGDEAEIEAQKAEMIRRGEASKHDTFITFVTIYEERPSGVLDQRRVDAVDLGLPIGHTA